MSKIVEDKKTSKAELLKRILDAKLSGEHPVQIQKLQQELDKKTGYEKS